MRDQATPAADLFAPIARRAPLVVVGIEADGEKQISMWGEGAPAAAEDVIFEIGSVTKTFTALLLADMVHRKEVALSDPVSKYLGGENEPLSRLTLVDLATHTARLPGVPRDLLWRALRNRRDPYHGYGVARLRGALGRVKERNGIGRKFRYSNFGYAALGLVLSRAAGTPYDELIASRVCEPLGLWATSPAPEGELKQRCVQGYKKRGEPTTSWNLEAFAPAGILKSCAADLLVYLRAHVEPSASPLEAALREVRRPRVAIRKGRLAIGLAWLVEQRHGVGITWHNGGTGGFSAFAGFDPAAGISLVALANSQLAGRLTRSGTQALELLSKRGLEAG